MRAALEYAHFRRASTMFVTCAPVPPTADGEPVADVVIELPTGPEVVAGSHPPQGRAPPPRSP